MEKERPDIFDSLRYFCVAGLELYKARLEVVLIELEEEKERIQHLLVLAIVAAVLLLLGAAVMTTLGVILLADRIGLASALALFALLYLVGAGALGGRIYRYNKARPPLLSSTLKEFQKDADCLRDFLQKHQKPACSEQESHASLSVL